MKQLCTILALAVVAHARLAQANCNALPQLSACIDVDTLWPRAGAGRFTFVGPTTPTPSGELGVGLVTTYLARPLVLQIPSSSGAGNEVPAVDRLWDTTLLWSLGVSPEVELSLALPFTIYRSGTGISSLSSQRTAELSRTAARDARIGASFGLARGQADSGLGHAVVSRLELALPLDRSAGFAGDRFVVMVPSVSGELTYKRLVFAAELGVRLRARSELLGARVGTQLVAALGVAAKLLDDDALTLLLEAMTLPTLLAQHDLTLMSGAVQRTQSGSRGALAPTEWQLSLRTAPLLAGDASLSVGAGGSLPLTGDYGVTSPSFRLVVALRYAPKPPIP